MSLPLCDSKQCNSLMSTPWQAVYTACSILVPVSISFVTYSTMRPMLENDVSLVGCSQEGHLRRSMKSFNWSCLVASALAFMISGGMEINTWRLHKLSKSGAINLMQVARGRHTAFWIATLLKSSVLISIVVSASVAYGTYQKCKREALEKRKAS